jgi:acrylyl-CoA reductase (NADPH)
MDTFKALIVDQKEGETMATIQKLGRADLPEGDVTVVVAYSSLNYKDGLAVTGQGKVLRSHPLVPGVDMAGTVLESDSAEYQAGDKVVLTGFEHGEKYWGGFTQLTRVGSKFLVPLPEGLTLRQAMAIGTAGLTAMLSVMALEEARLSPGDQREVVVTGAAGGVGSTAVAILGQLGYNVVASTGRAETYDYLRSLGAKDFIEREVLASPSKRPLESERWAGAVDAVGGDTTAGLLRTMARGGSIALSGNAGGFALNTTVLPFILRGVNILGIDSNLCPLERRREAWRRLATQLPLEMVEAMTQEISLADVPAFSQEILQGKVRGRTVISLE